MINQILVGFLRNKFVVICILSFLLHASLYDQGKVGSAHNPKTSWLDNGEFLIGTNVIYPPAPGYQERPSIACDGTNYLVVWVDKRDGYYQESKIYGSRISSAGDVLNSFGIVISNAEGDQHSLSVAFDGTNYLVVWEDQRDGYPNADIYGARVSQDGVVLDSSGIAITTATGRQNHPYIAFDGSNYLVVWMDRRSGSWDIYGARVSQEGAVLDSSGIAIDTTTDEQGCPTIGFDGTNYLVVWQSHQPSYWKDIRGARVSPAGVVLDPLGIAIDTTAEVDSRYPAVAFDGTNYLVVKEDYRSGGYYDIYGIRISPAGVVLDSFGIAIETTADIDSRDPVVAFDGTNYLIVWGDKRSDEYDIYSARVSPDGVVLDPSGFAITTAAGHQIYPAVAYDGINYLAVWEDGRLGHCEDIFGARVTSDGDILDPSGFTISTIVNYQNYPFVAFDSSNYLVVWEDWCRVDHSFSSDIYSARVSQDGIVLDSSGITIDTTADVQSRCPCSAFDGANYLVIWQDLRSVDDLYFTDLCGVRVNPAGEVIDSSKIVITTVADYYNYPQIYSAIAVNAIPDSTNFLVVWADNHTGSYNIYGTRISPDGVILDPSGIDISTAWNLQIQPAAASDGTDYLVAWIDGRSGSYCHIYGARVNQDGIVLDPSGIAIDTTCQFAHKPTVAFDGVNYLVVWNATNLYPYSSDIYCTRLSQDGIVLDPTPIAICSTIGYPPGDDPIVVFDGTDYLVVWQDSSIIYGAWVSPDGVVINSFTASLLSGNDPPLALALGYENQILITYSCWTDSINGYATNTMRIWGKLFYEYGVEEETEIQISGSPYSLQIFPNPFSERIAVAYQISNASQNINVNIYDVSGRLVKKLVNNEFHTPGSYTKFWQGLDDIGRAIPSGIYFVKFKAGEFSETQKILLLK